MSTTPNIHIQEFFHAHQEAFLEDLARLVEIPSVVTNPLPGMPYGEAPYRVLHAAVSIAERMGFRTAVADDCCMTAEYGNRPIQLSLLAHLDVVDAGNGWTKPPYRLTREGGLVYGRGVADDKGACIALLYAMQAARKLNPDLPYSPQAWFGTAEEMGSPDLRNYMKHTQLAPYVLTPDALHPVTNGESGKHRPSFHREWLASDVRPQVTLLDGGSVRNAIPGYASATVSGLCARNVESVAAQITAQTEVHFTLLDTDTGLTIKAKGRGAHIGRPELGRNAQTALVALLAALPLADCSGTEALRALSQLFPYEDLEGKALGLTVRDDIFGSSKNNFTVCHMNETGIRCTMDSRGPLAATPENYSNVIDAALQRAGFQVDPSTMDFAHYVPEEAPLVQKAKTYYEMYFDAPAICHTSIGASYAHYVDGAISTSITLPQTDSMLHKSDEWMRIDDLLRTGMMYTAIILDICTG